MKHCCTNILDENVVIRKSRHPGLCSPKGPCGTPDGFYYFVESGAAGLFRVATAQPHEKIARRKRHGLTFDLQDVLSIARATPRRSHRTEPTAQFGTLIDLSRASD